MFVPVCCKSCILWGIHVVALGTFHLCFQLSNYGFVFLHFFLFFCYIEATKPTLSRHTHPLGWRSSSLSTVWSQYSNTRWSFRLRRNTSIRFTRLACFSCCKDTKQRRRHVRQIHLNTWTKTSKPVKLFTEHLWLALIKQTKLLTDGNKHAVTPDNPFPSCPIYELLVSRRPLTPPTHSMTNETTNNRSASLIMMQHKTNKQSLV